MSDSMRKYVGSYSSYYNTSNHDLIKLVIESDDEMAKDNLAYNSNLTPAEMIALVKSGSKEARGSIARSEVIPLELLLQLTEDKVESVRVEALGNPLTNSQLFTDAIMHGVFSLSSKKQLCRSSNAVTRFEVFEFLWLNIKGAPEKLIHTLEMATFQEQANIDAHIIDFIHGEIQKGDADKAAREAYAGNWRVSTPELLDQMKDDEHRPVINGIAQNQRAWVSTHEYLLAKHKSIGIRYGIARATSDNPLLNKIYHGTKNEKIREEVQRNPSFNLLD